MGLRSSSILAALFNAVALLITVGIIAVESVRRLYAPEPVAGLTVMIVAAMGIGRQWRHRPAVQPQPARWISILQGVFLHMLGDAVVSLGVVIGGAAVLATGWPWIDPSVGLLVAAFLVISTWRLLTQSVAMALHAVPSDIDPDQVMAFLGKLNGVAQVHDLHIWPMSTTERALTCHLVMPAGHPGDHALADLAHELEHRFRIGHATIQVETGDPVNLLQAGAGPRRLGVRPGQLRSIPLREFNGHPLGPVEKDELAGMKIKDLVLGGEATGRHFRHRRLDILDCEANMVEAQFVQIADLRIVERDRGQVVQQLHLGARAWRL